MVAGGRTRTTVPEPMLVSLLASPAWQPEFDPRCCSIIPSNEALPGVLRLSGSVYTHLWLYDSWVGFLERKPYPHSGRVAKIFALAVRLKPEIAGFNPLVMWNTIT
jgi:hypothetical protein